MFRVYTSDGSCNNVRDGSLGQTGRPHKRMINPAYGDGTGKTTKFAWLLAKKVKYILNRSS